MRRAVRQAVEAVARVEMRPVQVADVRQQEHAVLALEARGEIEHLVRALEHVEPARAQFVGIERPARHRRDAAQQRVAR